METKANYVLVGVFTVVILVLSFGFVYWSANVSDQDRQVPMLVRIEGSVTGLGVGSQVLFNGLRVGDVRSLRIDPNDPRVVIATTQVESTTPITTSTRATIGFAGLTGQAFIELKGGSVTERNVIAYAQEQGAVPVIKADPSDVTDILATAKDIAERANNILTQFESVVGDVGPAVRTTASNVTATSQNIKVFTDNLAANSGQIDEFLGSISRLAGTANTVAEALPDAIRSAQSVIEAVDPNSVRATVDNVAALTQTLREQSGKVASVVASVETAAASIGSVGAAVSRNAPAIDRFLASLGPISQTATSVAQKLDTSLTSANDILAAIEPARIEATLGDVAGAARAVANVATSIGDQSGEIRRAIAGVAGVVDNIDRITDNVSENSEAIGEFLGDLGPVTRNANRALVGLNDTLGSANRVIAAVDPAKVADTLAGISGIAATINARSAAIGEAIGDASGALRNVNELTTSLSAKRQTIDAFIDRLGPIGANAASASARINEAAESASQLVSGIDRSRVSETVDKVAGLVAGIEAKTPEIQSIIDGLDGTVRTVGSTLNGFDVTRRRIDAIVAGIDAKVVNQAVTDVSAATDNVARAADSIASIANDIGARRDDINRIITNAEATSAKVSTASTRLDTVLASLDRLLNASSTEGLAKEASATLASIRRTADGINARIGPIAENIQSFSGNGLREVRSLVRDVTRSVNRIEGAVSDFQSNPSRLIFGGDEVKQFDGRTRR